MNKQEITTTRVAYLDNLKALMIIFVVLVHTAVTYSGIGSWYYKEPTTLSVGSFYFFLFFETFMQAYFMSMFFMIAGYFVPQSLAKKGPKKYSTGRAFRLGIPVLIYMFLLQPLCVKLVLPKFNLIHFYIHGITTLSFLGWTGPLWFALALLVFTFIYVLLANKIAFLITKYNFSVNIKNIFILISIITIIAFGIRLVFPIGTSIYNMQLCFFSAYIFMFLVGTIAQQKRLFENITYKIGKNWFITAFAVGIPLWIAIIYFGASIHSKIQNFPIIGGWNIEAFGYALWESFFCVTIIIGLVGIFKYKFNAQNRLQKFLSTNAFAVYVFHPIVLITTSLLLQHLHCPALLKFVLVGSIAVPASFIVASLLRKIKIVGQLFA